MDVRIPGALIGALIITAAGIVVGRLRHDSPTTILLDIAGYVTFLLALGWAISVGHEAFWAAAAASLGSLMFTSAAGRRTAGKMRAA